MATVLSLAVKIFADATGITEQLTPVERAINGLNAEAEKVTKTFEKFAASSEAAAAVQEKFEVRFQALREALEAGLVTPSDFAKQFDALREAANSSAADFERASKIVADSLTEEERAQAAFSASTDELNRLRELGLLTEEQYSAALERAAEKYAKATVEAGKASDATASASSAAKDATLKFNELSVAIGLLPGPFGALASRISSIASASEGLGKVLDNPTKAIGDGLSKALDFVGTTAGRVTIGLAAFGAAATAITRGLTDLESRVQRLGNTADKLGVSFEFVQVLENAANRSGTSIEAVDAAFGRLQKTLAGAGDESKKAQNALAGIGVTVEQLKSLSPEEQYRLIGERLQAIKDPAERTAAAMQLFGKTGASLLPFFKNFGIAADDMERFGRALTNIDRKRVDDFGNGLNALKTATSGLGQTLLLPFVGLGEGVTRAFAEITAGITRIVDPIGKVLEPLFTQIGRIVEIIGTNIGTVGRVIGAVLEPFGTVAQAVSTAVEPLYDSLVGINKAISDGAVSVTRWIVSFTPIGVIAANAQKLSEYLSRVVTIITTAFSKGFEAVGKLFSETGEAVGTVVNKFLDFTGIGDTVRSVLGAIGSAFGNLWDTIKGIISGIGGFIERVLQFAEDWLGIKRDVEEPVTATIEVDGGGAIADILKENKEFQKTLDSITAGVSNAIDESAKFGQAGVEAALKYQTAIAELKDKLDRGFFNEETFRREAAKAGEAFKNELAAIEEDSQLEIKIKEEASQTLGQLQQQINKVVEDAMKFGDAGSDAAFKFQERVRELGRAFEDGRLNSEALRQEVEKATAEYNKQIESLKRIEDVKKRFSTETSQEIEVQKDLTAIQEEQARLQEEIARRRKTTVLDPTYDTDVALAEKAERQLDELDRLEQQVLEQQQAIEQGFGDSFSNAFKQTQDGIDSIIAKAGQLAGRGGLPAQFARDFAAVQAEIARIQEQARSGILSKGQYDAAIQAQRQLLEEYVRGLEQTKRYEAELDKRIENEKIAANQRINRFLNEQLRGRTEEAIKAEEEIAKRKREAAYNIEEIEKQIESVRQARDAARDEGNKVATAQRQQELKALEELRKREQELVDGKESSATRAARLQQESLARANASAQESASQFQAGLDQASQIMQASMAAVNQANQASVAYTAEYLERIRKALTIGPTQVATADIRTQEGQQIVQSLTAQAQDPLLIQNRLLAKINQNITDAVVRFTSTGTLPVRI